MPRTSSGRYSKKSSGKLPKQKLKKPDKRQTKVQETTQLVRQTLLLARDAKPFIFYLNAKGSLHVRLETAKLAKEFKPEFEAIRKNLVSGLLTSLRLDPSYKVKDLAARAMQTHGRPGDIAALKNFSESMEARMIKIKDPKDKKKWALRGEIMHALFSANRAIEMIELREKIKRRVTEKSPKKPKQ